MSTTATIPPPTQEVKEEPTEEIIPKKRQRRNRDSKRPSKKPKRESDPSVTWLKFKNCPDCNVKAIGEAIQEILERKHEAGQSLSGYDNMEVMVFPDQQIRTVLSTEQKEENKRIYRHAYNRKPETIESRKKKEADPAYLEKRATYAQDPAVKEARALSVETSKIKRQLIKKFNPALDKEMRQKALEIAKERIAEKKKKNLLTTSRMELEAC
jgi:hypothetical protein